MTTSVPVLVIHVMIAVFAALKITTSVLAILHMIVAISDLKFATSVFMRIRIWIQDPKNVHVDPDPDP